MDFLSAPSNFLAQWFRNVDSKILGLTILSVKVDRMAHRFKHALSAQANWTRTQHNTMCIYIYIYIYTTHTQYIHTHICICICAMICYNTPWYTVLHCIMHYWLSMHWPATWKHGWSKHGFSRIPPRHPQIANGKYICNNNVWIWWYSGKTMFTPTMCSHRRDR